MKRLILAVLFILLLTNVRSFSIWKTVIPREISFSGNASSNAEGEIFDYTVESETENENIYTSVKTQRISGKVYKAHDFRIHNEWNYFGALTRWSKWDVISLEKYQVAVVGIYKGWYSGPCQSWYNNHPTTEYLLGKKYAKSFNVFLIPFSLAVSQEFYTPSFSEWHYETSVKFKFRTETKVVDNIVNLLSEKKINTGHINLFFKYVARDYSDVLWELQSGIGVDF